MKKILIFILFFNCKSPKQEWDSLIKNNSLEGWHIFQDDGEKSGWEV